MPKNVLVRLTRILWTVAGCLLLVSCFDTSDGKLIVVNQTDRTIVFAYGDAGDGGKLSEAEPYTTDLNGNPVFRKTDGKDEFTSFILPHAQKRMWRNGFWDHIFLDESFPGNKKTAVYILDADTVRKYSWKEIRRRNMILTTLNYSRQDLEKQGWKIVYSGLNFL